VEFAMTTNKYNFSVQKSKQEFAWLHFSIKDFHLPFEPPLDILSKVRFVKALCLTHGELRITS
jgi:hypothetical protein